MMTEWLLREVVMLLWLLLVIGIYVAIEHGFVTMQVAGRCEKWKLPKVLRVLLRFRMMPAPQQKQGIYEKYKGSDDSNSTPVATQPAESKVTYKPNNGSQHQRPESPSKNYPHAPNLPQQKKDNN